MKRIRALARQSPAIIISLVALTFSLGSGAGYAASVATHRAAAPKITWHKLKLLNGWHDSYAILGAPSYTVINGVVYLAGGAAIKDDSSSLPVLAVLPKGARPRHYLELGAFSSSAVAPAYVAVAANGDIWSAGGNAYYSTSLAGISFPVGE